MYKRVSRVIREYVLWTEEAGCSVKGRIVEHLDSEPNVRYGWEVSHHYKGSQTAADVYRPSTVTGASVEEVEGLMLGYLRGFTGIGAEPNPYY